jgi:hypothetical protein
VIAAVKRHIPQGYRNKFILEWDHQYDEFYERFNSDHEKESAVRLFEKVNEQKKSRWEDFVEKNKLHTLQPQSLEPTEEIRHQCLTNSTT